MGALDGERSSLAVDYAVASSGEVPVYKEFPIALAANGDYTLFVTGNVMNIIDLSGSLKISINDGPESTARAGIGYTMPEGKVFNRIRFREFAAGAATITIATALGQIQDNRASFAGNQSVQNASIPNDELQVKTKGGTTLATALASGDPGIAAAIAALQASNSLRERYTSLASATYRRGVNEAAETTIVTGGANVNGILVKLAKCYKEGAANDCYFAAGAGNVFCGFQIGATTSITQVDTERNIFIPAGVALISKATSTTNYNAIWYQVL